MKQYSWRNWIGIVACLALMGSCFMHWTWYPDIQKYFTGFFTEKNYYGKPGYFLMVMGVVGLANHALRKIWLARINLAASGLAMAYAIKSFLLFTSSYDGYVPQKQFGIYLMLVSAIVNMVITMISMDGKKKNLPHVLK